MSSLSVHFCTFFSCDAYLFEVICSARFTYISLQLFPGGVVFSFILASCRMFSIDKTTYFKYGFEDYFIFRKVSTLSEQKSWLGVSAWYILYFDLLTCLFEVHSITQAILIDAIFVGVIQDSEKNDLLSWSSWNFRNVIPSISHDIRRQVGKKEGSEVYREISTLFSNLKWCNALEYLYSCIAESRALMMWDVRFLHRSSRNCRFQNTQK